MFTKLLKHDLKANAGLLGLLGGCALGVGCLAAVVLRLLTTHWEQITAKDELMLILIPAILFLFFAYLAIILYGVCTQYILLFRFYKSRFTDEGYLMFTLPVKTSHIFLSGALNILIWSLIAVVVIIASLAIAVGIGPAWTEEVLEEIRWAFGDMRFFFSEVTTHGYGIGMVLNVLIMGLYSIIAPMSAVVLGATIAKKHKVLAIIGIMIGISMVTSTINGIITSVMQLLLMSAQGNVESITTLTPLVSSIVPLLLAVGGYFLSIHLMKKKLNLP